MINQFLSLHLIFWPLIFELCQINVIQVLKCIQLSQADELAVVPWCRSLSERRSSMSFCSCMCFTGLPPHVSVVSDCLGPPSSEVQRVSHTVINQSNGL